MSGRRVALIAAVVVVVLAGAAVLVWWLSDSRAEGVKQYKAKTSAAWKKISSKSGQIASALAHVSSKDDLQEVAIESYALKTYVDNLTGQQRDGSIPSGYRELAKSQAAALASLSAYLGNLSELATRQSSDSVIADLPSLQNDARAAQDAVNDFLSQAEWLGSQVEGDLYQAPQTLSAALQPQNQAQEAQRQVIYEALKTFIETDIYQHDFNRIYSMLSSRWTSRWEAAKITREQLVPVWKAAWGTNKPKSYYINKAQIAFPSPDRATVKTIIYNEDGTPLIKTVKLVNEGGTWKIDSYPFAGIEDL